MPPERYKPTKTDQLVIGIITDEVRREFGNSDIDPMMPEKKCREPEITIPRHIIWTLSANYCGFTTKKSLARYFNTTHSNIIAAMRRVDELVKDSMAVRVTLKIVMRNVEERISRLHERP